MSQNTGDDQLRLVEDVKVTPDQSGSGSQSASLLYSALSSQGAGALPGDGT